MTNEAPFKIQGRVKHCVIENLPVIARDGEAPECYVGGDADFVLRAMNNLAANEAKIAALETALRGVLFHYKIVLGMLHDANHTQREQKHCSIVACMEGLSNISSVRAALAEGKK